MDVSEQQSSAATIGSAFFVQREGVPPAAYSVSEVIDIAAEAVKLTFPEEVWIQGEVANYRPAGSNRHCYFDLAERQSAENGRKWDAAVTAIIWKQRWPSLSAKLRAAGVEIQNGQEMLFRARVRLFDGGGKLSLHITDVFPEFTLGRIEQERRAILARLEGEGLLGINQRLSLPPVPLRIALVSSSDARGMSDFLHVLQSSGYGFTVRHVNAAVQGCEMEREICSALALITQHHREWSVDVVCIVRGGGNASDLGWWNNYAICAAVARMPLPVICGIGHEKDVVATEDVAHTRASTPTAAAQLLVKRVCDQEVALSNRRTALLQAASRLLTGERDGFDGVRGLFTERARFVLSSLKAAYEQAGQQLGSHAVHQLRLEGSTFESQRTLLANRVVSLLSALRTAHEHTAEQITRDARCGLDAAKTKLANTAERLRSEGLHALASQGRTLLSLELRLRDIAPAALERASQSVERARLLVDAHDPLAILKRGYSVTLDASGKPIKDATVVQPGDRIVTLLADGRLSSIVDDVSPSASHG